MSLSQDVRVGWRHLSSRPSWSLSIILVLAIGIAANTAVFSAFEAWVLRPLDFPAPERLVGLFEARPKLGRSRIALSAQNYGDWVEQQSTFEALGAFRRHRFNLADDGEPIRLEGAQISAELFPLLGKTPALGRGFGAEDDRPGQPAAVALISRRLWRERFGSDPDVLGRTIRLDGRVHEIVGVMVRESLILSAGGIFFGVMLTLFLGRVASSMLVAVSVHDPTSFAVVAGVLLIVTAGAAFVPARRASLVDPIRALRAE